MSDPGRAINILAAKLEELTPGQCRAWVMTAEEYTACRFDVCQLIAERLGLKSYYQWESEMERRYTTMPAWYWRRHQQGGPEHHYCDYVAGKIDGRKDGIAHLFETFWKVGE